VVVLVTEAVKQVELAVQVAVATEMLESQPPQIQVAVAVEVRVILLAAQVS
jgi:hypothetical protein